MELSEPHARAEVIICSGVFNSPQLSGIEPGDLLQDMGIPWFVTSRQLAVTWSPRSAATTGHSLQFLETKPDARALTVGMQLAHEFTQQPTLAPNVAEELLPGRKVNTDVEFEENIR